MKPLPILPCWSVNETLGRWGGRYMTFDHRAYLLPVDYWVCPTSLWVTPGLCTGDYRKQAMARGGIPHLLWGEPLVGLWLKLYDLRFVRLGFT